MLCLHTLHMSCICLSINLRMSNPVLLGNKHESISGFRWKNCIGTTIIYPFSCH